MTNAGSKASSASRRLIYENLELGYSPQCRPENVRACFVWQKADKDHYHHTPAIYFLDPNTGKRYAPRIAFSFATTIVSGKTEDNCSGIFGDYSQYGDLDKHEHKDRPHLLEKAKYSCGATFDETLIRNAFPSKPELGEQMWEMSESNAKAVDELMVPLTRAVLELYQRFDRNKEEIYKDFKQFDFLPAELPTFGKGAPSHVKDIHHIIEWRSNVTRSLDEAKREIKDLKAAIAEWDPVACPSYKDFEPRRTRAPRHTMEEVVWPRLFEELAKDKLGEKKIADLDKFYADGLLDIAVRYKMRKPTNPDVYREVYQPDLLQLISAETAQKYHEEKYNGVPRDDDGDQIDWDLQPETPPLSKRSFNYKSRPLFEAPYQGKAKTMPDLDAYFESIRKEFGTLPLPIEALAMRPWTGPTIHDYIEYKRFRENPGLRAKLALDGKARAVHNRMVDEEVEKKREAYKNAFPDNVDKRPWYDEDVKAGPVYYRGLSRTRADKITSFGPKPHRTGDVVTVILEIQAKKAKKDRFGFGYVGTVVVAPRRYAARDSFKYTPPEGSRVGDIFNQAAAAAAAGDDLDDQEVAPGDDNAGDHQEGDVGHNDNDPQEGNDVEMNGFGVVAERKRDRQTYESEDQQQQQEEEEEEEQQQQPPHQNPEEQDVGLGRALREEEEYEEAEEEEEEEEEDKRRSRGHKGSHRTSSGHRPHKKHRNK